MNSKLLSVAVFLTLMLTSLLAGRHNYCKARNEITADLNQALAQTLKERKDYIITQDTIRVYKQLRKTSGGQVLIAVSDERFCRYLKDKRLQQAAFITFDVVDSDFQNNSLGDQAICSDTLIVKDKHAGETLALKGYARLSVASILGMSDQRIPAACMISAFLWAMLSWLYLRKKQEGRFGSCHRFWRTGLFGSGPAVLYGGTHSYPLYSNATAAHVVILECSVTFTD